MADDQGSQEYFEDDEEKEHFRSVIASFKHYEAYSLQSVARSENSLAKLIGTTAVRLDGLTNSLVRQREAIKRNAKLLMLIVKDAEAIFENVPTEEPADDGLLPSPQNMDVSKVQSTLRQLVRDWSSQGLKERELCYQPIINEITEHFPDPRDVGVLVPGAGLGRLAFEIAARGYRCQGNEFSLYMLFTSNFVFNQCHQVNQHTVQPWVHQSANWLTSGSQLAECQFPDIDPSLLTGAEFSMAAGDFTKVYKTANEWDCVATCFFIDCAPNIIFYIETIFHVLKPGGVWVNLGPLLYHYKDLPNEHSIEPPFDELCNIIQDVGFRILKCRTALKTTYTQNPASMLQNHFDSVFFVCRKPSTAAAPTPATAPDLMES